MGGANRWWLVGWVGIAFIESFCCEYFFCCDWLIPQVYLFTFFTSVYLLISIFLSCCRVPRPTDSYHSRSIGRRDAIWVLVKAFGQKKRNDYTLAKSRRHPVRLFVSFSVCSWRSNLNQFSAVPFSRLAIWNSYGSHLVCEQGPDQVSSSFVCETRHSISSFEEIIRHMFGKGQEGKLTAHTHDGQSTRGRHSVQDWRKPSWFSLLSDSLNFENAETCLCMRIQHSQQLSITDWGMAEVGARISDVGCGPVTFI